MECRQRTWGFTLLELAIVLVVVGTFSALLAVRIEGVLTGGDLREASRMIMGEIRSLRGKAASTRAGQILAFDIDGNSFYPLDEKTSKDIPWELASEFDDEADKTTGTPLPKGVELMDVAVLSRGKIQEGEARIQFFANGCIEQSMIHLKNEKDEVYTLEINPVTGRVRIHETYVDQKEIP
jgi:prepilin-type N-terminal cleavage/methylation domain-containing protein